MQPCNPCNPHKQSEFSRREETTSRVALPKKPACNPYQDMLKFIADSNGAQQQTITREFSEDLFYQAQNAGDIVYRKGKYVLNLDSPKPEVKSE